MDINPGANLRGRDLRGRDLRGRNLEEANLEGANLEEANLEGANLTGVNLVGANLKNALLATYLGGSINLTNADLRRANLEGAMLVRANLEGANLEGANLESANLTNANLTNANLRNLELFGTRFNGANLTNANLTGVDVGDEVNIEGANLTGANLTGANFRRAHLEGAILEGAILTNTILDPNRPQPQPQPQPQPPRLNEYALGVHEAASNINYDKLNEFLSEKNGETVQVQLNASYINNSIVSIIDSCNATEEQKRGFKRDLNRIMRERLQGTEYEELSSVLKNAVKNSLEYVKRQQPEFKRVYIESFCTDCVNAHGINGMSCAAGILERIILSLTPACYSFLSNTKNDGSDSEEVKNKSQEYETLIGIIVKNIREHIIDWYKLHKQGTEQAFAVGTGVWLKREDLKRYLLSKFPDQSELIEQEMVKWADSIGYEEDDFTYGGKKRKTHKRKSYKRKTYKRKTYKRKTYKRKTYNKRKTHKRIKKSKRV